MLLSQFSSAGAHITKRTFTGLFALRFALQADSETLVSRLRPREPLRWADGSPALQQLLDWNSRFEAFSKRSDAILIDSTVSTGEIADNILSYVKDLSAGKV